VRKTTVAIDDQLAAQAGRALGTTTLTDTVREAMRLAIATAARRKFVDRLSAMRGLDLDDPSVMKQAWR
jgi:Arc/MetJ family transcription regulator